MLGSIPAGVVKEHQSLPPNMPLGRKEQNEKQRVQKLIMAENFLPRSLDRAVVWVYALEQKSKRVFIRNGACIKSKFLVRWRKM